MIKWILILVLALCLLFMAAATLIDLSNQVRGTLGSANGGVGQNSSAWTGFPKVASGVWSSLTGTSPKVPAYDSSGNPVATNGPVYFAPAYGVVANGTDQCGTNFQNLVNAVNSSGGTILFDIGTTLLATCNFTGTYSLGSNAAIAGRGAGQSNTKTTPVSPPAILKMTYAGTDAAHIECLTYGGQCGAQNLTVQDDTTTLPFFLYTGGIPYIRNVSCWGKTSRVGGGRPVNDCVWLGYLTNSTCTGTTKAAETDGYCDYGLAFIDVYCHNIRVCVQFGSNANGNTVFARGDFTDAYVDVSLNPIGGFVQFQADASGHASYGNRVFINNEMAPFGGGACNYLGAFNMIAYATNNIVTINASDPGTCAYTGYVQDTTSSRNYLIAQVGSGTSGEISDAGLGSGNNTIIDMPSRIFYQQTSKVNNVYVGGGSTQVFRCTTAGAVLPAGSLTTDSTQCGTSNATGLRTP